MLTRQDLVPGEVYGNANERYLVIEHDECGCVFFRAVELEGSEATKLCAERDDELAEMFADRGCICLGKLTDLVTPRFWAPPARPKKVKRAKA